MTASNECKNVNVEGKDAHAAIARGNQLHSHGASEKEPLERGMAMQIGINTKADTPLPCPKQSS
jgi:hypothetical protein